VNTTRNIINTRQTVRIEAEADSYFGRAIKASGDSLTEATSVETLKTIGGYIKEIRTPPKEAYLWQETH
jgi:hypothetical protein